MFLPIPAENHLLPLVTVTACDTRQLPIVQGLANLRTLKLDSCFPITHDALEPLFGCLSSLTALSLRRCRNVASLAGIEQVGFAFVCECVCAIVRELTAGVPPPLRTNPPLPVLSLSFV